jgi:hypothetical protein
VKYHRQESRCCRDDTDRERLCCALARSGSVLVYDCCSKLSVGCSFDAREATKATRRRTRISTRRERDKPLRASWALVPLPLRPLPFYVNRVILFRTVHNSCAFTHSLWDRMYKLSFLFTGRLYCHGTLQPQQDIYKGLQNHSTT